MREEDFLRSNVGVIFLFLVLLGSLSINVLLFYRYEKVTHPVFAKVGIQTGMSLRPFAIVDDKGEKTQLDFSGSQPTVLYILAPTCGWCQRNRANVTALASKRGGQYRFVGLSITSYQLKEFWRTTTLPFPVYSMGSLQVASDYHFSDETPQMAVVTKGGKIERVWHGALMDNNLFEAEKYFGVSLPGLLTVAAAQDAPRVDPEPVKLTKSH